MLTLHVLVLAQLGVTPYSLQLVILDHTGVQTGTNPQSLWPKAMVLRQRELLHVETDLLPVGLKNLKLDNSTLFSLLFLSPSIQEMHRVYGTAAAIPE